MRNLWRALALAWLGGVASPNLVDDVIQPEIVVEVDEFDDGDEAADREAAEALAPRSGVEG
jgi:hypothetical protein